MAAIQALAERGIVPPGRPSPEALAAVTQRVSIDITGQPRAPLDPLAVEIRGVARATLTPVESGCVRITPTGSQPQLVLAPRRPASFKVVTYVAGGTFLLFARTGSENPVGIPVPATRENAVFVNLADPRAVYLLGVPEGGRTNVCGLGQQLPTPG